MPVSRPYSVDSEMENRLQDLHYSIIHEDMQDIISRPPTWLTRWGTTMLLAVVTSFLLISYFIRYPERISVPLHLVSSAAPVAVSARTGGRLQLLVHGKQQVARGQLLGFLETGTDPSQAAHLSEQLATLRVQVLRGLAGAQTQITTADYGQLGELESSFIDFKRQQAAYTAAQTRPEGGSGPAASRAYLDNYLQAVDSLRSRISAWQRANVFVAPIAGSVGFASFPAAGQEIRASQRLFYVIPLQKDRALYGELTFAQPQARQMREGQEVIVRLVGYPTSEFGPIRGRLSAIADLASADGSLRAQVVLPQGLETTYHKNIGYYPGMMASAEITVSNPRLLEKMFPILRGK